MMTLVQAQAAEAHRRLKLLGTTVEESKGTGLQARAGQIGVPAPVLHKGTPGIWTVNLTG